MMKREGGLKIWGRKSRFINIGKSIADIITNGVNYFYCRLLYLEKYLNK